MKKPTVVEIAKRAGVSPTLVSFVINNHEKHLKRMNEETVARVRQVAEEMGYHRNELFAAARRGRSKVIALLARDVGVEYYARVLDRIMESTEQHGYSQKLLKLRSDDEVEGAVTRIQEYRVCGGIFIGVRNDIARQFWKMLGKPSFPALLINCDPSKIKGGVPIEVDESTLMMAAVSYLKNLGHSRIAYAGPTENEFVHQARRNAFVQACQTTGCLQAKTIALPWEQNDPHEELVSALTGAQRPTAVIAYSDAAALIVLQVAAALGLRVPRDLSVIGIDDNSYAPRLITPLTTFRQELSVIHDLYVPEFIESIETETPLSRRRKRLIPVTLIERASAGPAPK